MKPLAVLAIGILSTLIPQLYAAQAGCNPLELRSEIEVGPGDITLADLLPAGGCPQLYQAAGHVSLGNAPLPGSLRALDGGDIRRLLNSLAAPGLNFHGANIPERIVLRRAGSMKSCAEVARFVVAADPALSRIDGFSEGNLNCAGARGVPKTAGLELSETAWNSALRRWEFALQCVRAQQCVPFMVWARSTKSVPESGTYSDSYLDREAHAIPQRILPAVKRGDTATLTWDQAGIRVILPVTCLQAGAIGQFVLVRFQNATKTLRAEVVGAGTVRINL